MNLAIVNNTRANLTPYTAEILASIRDTGNLPEELADLFTLEVIANADGSPRAIIREA